MECFQTEKEAGSNQNENKPRPELIFSAEVDGRLPSWNELLGMEHWSRHQLKKALQETFLSGLRQSGGSCSMTIIFAKSSMSIAADTLQSFMETARLRRELKLLKLKLGLTKESTSKSKSTSYKAPPGDPPF